MHYSISHQTTEFGFLSITPRKKLLKHLLLSVKEGLALVRLGKHEYAVEAGQVVWLPFDCLTSISYLPQTQVSVVEVSCRVQQSMPKQAGFVELNELATAVLNRLATMAQDHQLRQDLYRVLLSELTGLKPTLQQSSLSQQISMWSPEQASTLASELQLALKVREARRRILSGIKEHDVIESLFTGSQAAYTVTLETICGKSRF